MTGAWRASAPLRADVAGGTIDLWPLYLLEPGASTVNVAIRIMARAEFVPGGDRWQLRAGDQGRQRTVRAGALSGAWRRSKPGDPFALVLRVLDHVSPPTPGRLTTWIDGPSGAGIGGSSALLIALYGLARRMSGERLRRTNLAEVARDLEASVLRLPTGVQDYYPAIHGGVLRLAYGPGGAAVERLAVEHTALEARMVLAYSGRPHASAPSNWVLYRRRLEQDPAAVAAFAEIARAADAAARALGKGDWRRLGQAMDRDWAARRTLDPALAPADLVRLEKAARAVGVAGAKCCGAASGGCMLFLLRRARDRAAVEAALSAAGGALLPFRVANHGVRVVGLKGAPPV